MFTAIGDVHGKYHLYLEIARTKKNTVQIGDLGFRYSCLQDVDPASHKIVGGNHENYDTLPDQPHYLGDWGFTSMGGTEFFFLRGAYSIDRDSRTIGIDWWSQEEIAIESFMEARKTYGEVRPRVVLSHTCPETISPAFLDGPYSRVHHTKTGWMLDELLQIHKPELWVFGHYHVSRTLEENGTKFVCLDELETMDVV